MWTAKLTSNRGVTRNGGHDGIFDLFSMKGTESTPFNIADVAESGMRSYVNIEWDIVSKSYALQTHAQWVIQLGIDRNVEGMRWKHTGG